MSAFLHLFSLKIGYRYTNTFGIDGEGNITYEDVNFVLGLSLTLRSREDVWSEMMLTGIILTICNAVSYNPLRT